jgi:hypothetical protein
LYSSKYLLQDSYGAYPAAEVVGVAPALVASVGPVAGSEYTGVSNSEVLGVVVWQLGLLAFLSL